MLSVQVTILGGASRGANTKDGFRCSLRTFHVQVNSISRRHLNHYTKEERVWRRTVILARWKDSPSNALVGDVCSTGVSLWADTKLLLNGTCSRSIANLARLMDTGLDGSRTNLSQTAQTPSARHLNNLPSISQT